MTAYRGYLIRSSSHGTWIERDGFLISWASSEEDARRIIREELTAANPTERYPSTHWVAFSTTKGGKRRAWRWAPGQARWFPISVLEAEHGLARGDFGLRSMVRVLDVSRGENPAPAKLRHRRDAAEAEWKRAQDELVSAWDRGAPSSKVDALVEKVSAAAQRFDEAKAAELEEWRAAGRPVSRRGNPSLEQEEAERFYQTLRVHETDFALRDLSGPDDATILSVDETRGLLAELTRLRAVEEYAREVAALNDDWTAGNAYVRASWVSKNNAAIAELRKVMRT